MNEDFTVVTTQDIKELRDAVREWKYEQPVRDKDNILRDAVTLLHKTHKLLDNMIKSTERHS